MNCFGSSGKDRDNTKSHSNGNDGGGCLRRGGPLKVVRFNALCREEWGYVLGLFLADGCAIRKTRYGVRFALQADEMDIAGRLVEMLGRLGLKPSVRVGPQGMRMVEVCVHSKILVMRLPGKRRLVEDVAYRERFFEEWGLFATEVAVAFIAGLIDGDGYCRVEDDRRRLGSLRRGSGMSKWTWTFSQSKLPFLVDYVLRVLGSIVSSNSVSVYGREPGRGSYGRKRIYEVRFRKSGARALLERGIAKYSLKVARWEKEVAELAAEWESERHYTASEVARIASVDCRVVKRWIGDGRIKYQRKGKGLWYFISGDDARRAVREFRREKERMERIKRSGAVSFVDACRTLGVSHSTLYWQYKTGQVIATLVREIGRRSISQYLMIPKKEMERLKRKCKHREEKEKRPE
nr:LAGLIDADG family homing endonuclease [Candidatus Njordarchaeota archaeon]